MTIKNILFLLALGASIAPGAEPPRRAHATLSATAPVNTTAKDTSSSGTANSTLGLTAPVMGLFVDDSGTISAVTGVPGSASISDPIILSGSPGGTWLAPSQTWALIRQDSGLAVLPFQRATVGQAVPIDAALASPDLVAFAPQSPTAVLYSTAQTRFQIIRNGQVTADFSTVGLFASPVRKLAIDDAGVSPIAIPSDGAYLLNPGAAPQLVYSGGAVSDAVFLLGGSTLLIADAGLHQLTAIDDVAGAASNRVLATGVGSGNVWIQPSNDSKLVFAVCADSRNAYRIDLTTPGAPQVLDLPASPMRPARVGNSAAFSFSMSSDGPVWMLLEDAGVMRVSFAARPVVDSSTADHSRAREVK